MRVFSESPLAWLKFSPGHRGGDTGWTNAASAPAIATSASATVERRIHTTGYDDRGTLLWDRPPDGTVRWFPDVTPPGEPVEGLNEIESEADPSIE